MYSPSPSMRSSLSSESTLSVDSMSSDSTVSSLASESAIESSGNAVSTEISSPRSNGLSGLYFPMHSSTRAIRRARSENGRCLYGGPPAPSRASATVTRQGTANIREVGSRATWVWLVKWLVLTHESLALHISENSEEKSVILLRDIVGVARTDLKPHCLLLETQNGIGLHLSFKNDTELRGWRDDLSVHLPRVSNSTKNVNFFERHQFGREGYTTPVDLAKDAEFAERMQCTRVACTPSVNNSSKKLERHKFVGEVPAPPTNLGEGAGKRTQFARVSRRASVFPKPAVMPVGPRPLPDRASPRYPLQKNLLPVHSTTIGTAAPSVPAKVQPTRALPPYVQHVGQGSDAHPLQGMPNQWLEQASLALEQASFAISREREEREGAKKVWRMGMLPSGRA
ncbi:hypothetical protein B0H17DRAFT_1065000 [Mycena rosella]|uniref:PH domain-containing protein n=1 Tax=Mycena rosella TaxID=1033263 RepID=A0AAD7DIG0_MYCRO|nr:hypothetical protein B0H17DRAFT_1065000 [Mycena rosella]